MRLTLAAAVVMAMTATAASAQEVKPLANLRLRWENVDQDGFSRDAHAVTVRARAGAEMISNDWRLLAEGEGTLALVERYGSGLNGKTRYPLVADPENIELNRLQLQYRGIKKVVATAGRQRVAIDDERFVGPSGWRQNEQTFDAARLEYGDPQGLQADLVYAWSVRTIWGINGRGGRSRAIGGDNLFAAVRHPALIGTLTVFAYLVDQDEAAVQGYRLSSQTYGLRFVGSRKISESAKLSYTLSYASQSDYHRNPNDYRADYWLGEVGAELGPARLGLGYEVLGADEGVPLTSFQTPLATLHKFQGWADKFLTTPPNGVRDAYASAGYGWRKAAGFDSITGTLVFHRFNSDRLDQHYGDEWDALVSAKRGRWTATAKFASYESAEFATDTRKLWLQLEWVY